ncbi:WXG100-like domain-containing protein [Nocardia grenadensis]|uniref:WXG100-like domain-containing protein n=1 Tax=Nocardia grenadensis TaxID=931537 RepID=UPI0007A508E5|nr:hypothetical protein [Nocardia grenadensis]
MGIEIPESLQWVAKYVVGAGDWPEGDETAMRRVESAWTKLATDLRDLDADANYAIDQVLASIEGDTAQAIADRWTQLGHGQGAFDGLIAHIETLADEIGDGAADIEQTKLVILAGLAIFAVEMAVALAAASTGIGAPAAAAEAAAAQVATRIAIRTAIKQLVQRILSKAALKAAARAAVRGAWEAALEETALDLGTKALQVATGRRDEITTEDLTEAGKNALTAAAGGAVTGAMGPDGLTSRNVPGGPEGGNPLANAAKDAAKETVAGVAGEVAGEATDAALNDREFSWENALAPENLSSAAAGGLQRGTETLGERNSGDGPNTTGEGSENGGDESPLNETSNSGDQQNGEAPGGRSEAGDREAPTTPQNSNQATQPAGTNSPQTPDTSTQPQTSSLDQQSPGQPAETGSQPAGQQPPSPPGTESTTSAEQEASPTGSESPQPAEPGPATPEAHPGHTDTGAPDTQQAQPTGSGPAESPPPNPDNETQTEVGDSPSDSQSAPEAVETPGPDDMPATFDPAPAPGTEPPRSTSSLNLGPDTTTSPDTGAPAPVTPDSATASSTDTTPGTNSATGQAPPGTTTPFATNSPAGQSTTAGESHPSRTDPGPASTLGNTATPGESTTGVAPPAGDPPIHVPPGPIPEPATTTAWPPSEEATTTTSAAATPTIRSTPVTVVVSPAHGPAEAPRGTTPPDTTAAPPVGAAPAPSPRNRTQSPASHASGPTGGSGTPDGSRNGRPPGMPSPTSDNASGSSGSPFNIFDPANHAQFLADFARPPIPARPATTESPADPPASAAAPAPGADDRPTTPNVAATTSTDTARADREVSPTRPRTPGEATPAHPPPSQPHWNAPRPTDPIWNAPDRSGRPFQHPSPNVPQPEPNSPDRSTNPPRPPGNHSPQHARPPEQHPVPPNRAPTQPPVRNTQHPHTPSRAAPPSLPASHSPQQPLTSHGGPARPQQPPASSADRSLPLRTTPARQHRQTSWDPSAFRAPESMPPPRQTFQQSPSAWIPANQDAGRPEPQNGLPVAQPGPNSRPRRPSPLRRFVQWLAPTARSPQEAVPAPVHPVRPVTPVIQPPDGRQEGVPPPDADIPESPFGSTPPFESTEMVGNYRGEHLPRNSVWTTSVDYLNEYRRSRARLTVRDGLLYDSAGNLFDTRSGRSVWGGGGRAIFVMDRAGNLYASNYHEAGLFHHSSFLAGGPVAAAGELVVINGQLRLLTDSSGHYRPSRAYTLQAVGYLRNQGVDIRPDQVDFESQV